jgi:hypothetical protein
MARFTLDRAALARIGDDPAIRERIDRLGEEIHAEARENIIQMRAVDTGRLLSSGFSEREGEIIRIGFQVDYATYVHEGEGGDRAVGPRPFLAQAALRDRGELK